MPKPKSTVYLLHGEAQLLLEETLNKLVKELLPGENVEFNYDNFDAETTDLTHVLAAANTLPVFAEKRLVIVRRSERYFEGKKSEDDEGKDDYQEAEKILSYAANPNPSTALVFLSSKKLDSRRKVFKELAKIVEVFLFSDLQYKDAAPWLIERAKLKYSKKLALDAAQYLISTVGRDSALLANELEKAAIYCVEKKEITLKEVQRLVFEDNSLALFDFFDALIEKKPQRALVILGDLIRKGEYPVKVNAMLSGQIRMLIAVKALKARGLNQSEIARITGKNEFAVKKHMQQEKHISMPSLVEAINILAETDERTKMGFGDAENLLLNAITRIAGLIK